MSALIVAMLSVVLWASYREVERALLAAAGERARGATAQVAGLLESAIRPSVSRIRLTAADPIVRDYLVTRAPAGYAPAADRLRELAGPVGPRTVTLWDTAGQKVVEVEVAGRPEVAGGRGLPPSHPPTRDGLGPLQASGPQAFVESVTTVSSSYPELSRIGILALRSTFTVSPPGLLARLVGDDAVVAVGNRDGSVWLDLASSTVVNGPDIDLSREGIARYETSGSGHIGALTSIDDTPFVVWVELSVQAVTAPARQFLSRMLGLGLLVALVGAVLVRALTNRVTRPLAQMTDVTEAIASGDYSRRVNTPRLDEIGRLGRAFDRMTEQVAHDITDREAAAHRLQVNEDRLRFTLSAARVGTWQMDLHTTVVEWSETMAPLFGIERPALPTTSAGVLDLIHHGDRDAVAACMTRETADRTEHEIQFRALQPDGSYKWVLGRSRLLTDASGAERILGVCLDISEQRQLEEQLQQSQKMDAIGKLAGGVAHDFNNLLTAILGFGNFVLESLDPGDGRRVHVEEILKAGRRAAELTSQLLAFSRKQLLQPSVIDMNATVNESLKLLGRLIGEHIQLVTALSPDVGRIRADPVQLHQIVMNLAINARDAMPQGGRLTIETANIDLDESYVTQHFAATPGKYVLLAVTDTGVGMDAAVRERMFEPFFTTKERGHGTGLGLATVYGAVKQAGGYIWAYSEPGRGSTFKVYLPRLAGDFVPDEVAPPPLPLATGNETVLLVEDEEAVRELTRLILSAVGYRVVEAANSVEAEALHLKHAGAIALMVTDVVLPGMSGPELFERLSLRDPRLKVIYMSGYTDDAVFRTGRLQPGVAFLQKPFTADGIRRKVREVLDSHA